METTSINQSKQYSVDSFADFKLENLMVDLLEKEFSNAVHKACSELFSTKWQDMQFSQLKEACFQRSLVILQGKRTR